MITQYQLKEHLVMIHYDEDLVEDMLEEWADFAYFTLRSRWQ